MKRYFVLRNVETRDVFQTQLLEEAPENSVEVDPGVIYDFTLAVFDQYPNPTAVIEGASIEDIQAIKDEKIAVIREEYRAKLALTDWCEIRLLARQIAIPEDVIAQRAALIAEANDKIAALDGGIMMKGSDNSKDKK